MRRHLPWAAIAALALGGCKGEKTGTLTPGEDDKPAGEQATTQPSGAATSPHGDAFEDAPPAGAPFSGLVKLDEGLSQEKDVKPTDVLFIMARESQGGGRFGRLVAVQRHGNVEFPKRYELSAKDVMVPGVPFAGPFIVMARLDRDGDPMTRGKDDLYAHVAEEVKPGQEGVHLVLEKGAPETVTPSGAPVPQAPSGAATQPSGAATQPQ